jgi:hypothetical protein
MASSLDEPYRGSGVDRPVGVPLPPDPMPLFRSGTLLKRWHYVTFWSSELMFCAARVHVGPITQEYWGVWDRQQKLFRQSSHVLARRVSLGADKVAVEDGDVSIDVPIRADDEFEVYRPQGGAYIWSRKQLCVETTAAVGRGSRRLRPLGTVLVDVAAGYHPRLTRWRWSAGMGKDQRGRAVAWNVIVGLFDSVHASERTVWVDGIPSEIGPVRFSDDLRVVSFSDGAEIAFRQEANIRKRVGLFLVKSRYDHAFGRA